MAAVLSLDGNGTAQHDRAGDDNAHQRDEQVHQPFGDALLQGQVLGGVHHHGLVIQGDILGPLAHHVDHFKVIVDVLLFLVAEFNQLDALFNGHVVQKHRVVAGNDIQHMGVVITDDLIHLVLLAEAVQFGDDVPQTLPGGGDDAAPLRRGQGEVDIVAEIGKKHNHHQLQQDHQQQPLRRFVDKVGVVLFAGIHNGQLQVGDQVRDDGGQRHGVDNGPALLGADGIAAIHLHQGNAQHHKGHHGDAGGAGKVE